MQVGGSGKGLKRLTADAIKPTSKKRKSRDAGEGGGRSRSGGDEQGVDVALKDAKAVRPKHPKGKQVRLLPSGALQFYICPLSIVCYLISFALHAGQCQ